MAVSRLAMTTSMLSLLRPAAISNLIWRADMSILYDLEGGIWYSLVSLASA